MGSGDRAGFGDCPTLCAPLTPSRRGPEISVVLKAPGYECSSIIAYFKMVDDEGFLCFPDNYQLGLDVLVRVTGQRPIRGT